MPTNKLDEMFEELEVQVFLYPLVGNSLLDKYTKSLTSKLVRLATEYQSGANGEATACGSLYDLLVARLGLSRDKASHFVNRLRLLDIHKSVTAQLSTYLPRL